MKQKELTDLTNEELLKKWKNIKLTNTITSVSLFFAIVITIIIMIMYGFGSFIFLTIFVAILAIINWTKNKALDKEVKSRNLK